MGTEGYRRARGEEGKGCKGSVKEGTPDRGTERGGNESRLHKLARVRGTKGAEKSLRSHKSRRGRWGRAGGIGSDGGYE